MLPNVSNYYRPRTVDEALALLASDKERNVVLGGGTQLALSSNPGIDGLVDLQELGLTHRRLEKSQVVLGSRCRPTDAIQFEGLHHVADAIVIKAASNYLAEVQRNRASFGGILISAASWADLTTALLATGADVVIDSTKGEKILSIDQFLETGPAKASQRSIIREIRIPTGGSGAYHRIAKTETDISIVAVAVRLDLVGSSVSRARVAVGGVSNMPMRLESVEKNLVDATFDEGSAESATREINLEAVSDFRASSEYRLEVTRVLVKRALAEIAQKAGK